MPERNEPNEPAMVESPARTSPLFRQLSALLLSAAASLPAPAFADEAAHQQVSDSDTQVSISAAAKPRAARAVGTRHVLPEPRLVPVTEPEGHESLRPWQRPLGIALTGAGALGLGVGAYLELRADSKGSSASALLVAGGALLAAGVVLWFSAPSAPNAAHVGLCADRLVLGGTF